ncbi:2-phospho-L-lactate guanylyltransferase [Rosistilla carotiformis]|uniref:2-phospho-L-lactate guanylyltransferase n=1 Tax=Rosistilla carotiformis TaxID=2528017 RepID=A0A518JMY6_9BACT|nr:TIGR04282 family arsenosugar biosynthesis glycosyltransferase [Rosistilla carotiformis]QDV66902.1 2-phospho-L-lactate guanylyltransferase [Rosistilla carotiformis]
MRTLGMFTKYWQPGKVKTRLAQNLGNDRAAAIYQICVAHLADQLSHCGDKRLLIVSPDSRVSDPCFAPFKNWASTPQGGGDLGDRMMRYFATAETDRDRLIVIGGDCPTVTPDRIEQAFDALGDSRVVIGPSGDGGYYLLGIRGPWHQPLRALFDDMPWGTDEVMARTRSVLDALEIEPHLLPTDRDVDTKDDLDALLRRLPSDPASNHLRAAIERVLNTPTTES